jgi:hypothetical protein
LPLTDLVGIDRKAARAKKPARSQTSSTFLDDPAPHIGHIYDLTGPESSDLDHYARVFSEALGRTIRYRDAPTSEWGEKLQAAGLSEHVVHHLTVMTELHKQGRYDRTSEDYLKLTGETPTSMADFVKLHAWAPARPRPSHRSTSRAPLRRSARRRRAHSQRREAGRSLPGRPSAAP